MWKYKIYIHMVEKIIQILDYRVLGEITELLRQGTKVQLGVSHMPNTDVWKLTFQKIEVLSFECSRCGRPQYNAISSILQTINGLTDPKKKVWTRKEINALISF